MAIKNKYSATTTCDLLLTNDYERAQPRQQSVVAVDEHLVRTVIRIVPRGSGLIGVSDNDNFATFVTSVVATPTQNLRNFSRALRRFQVGRAGLGADHIEFAACAKSDVRARIHVATTLTSFQVQKVSSDVLTEDQAFECFSNFDQDATFTLPRAKRSNIGLEYYFAGNPDNEDGSISIECHDRDAIQIRAGQAIAFPERIRGVGSNQAEKEKADTNGVVVTPPPDIDSPDWAVVRCGLIKATVSDDAAKRRTTVVLACRGVGLWVAESVAASAGGKPGQPIDPANPGPTPTPVEPGDPAKPDPPNTSIWIPYEPRDA